MIRLATPADALPLSRLAAATFRETFESHNTAEDMTRYVAEAFSRERQAAEIADPASTVIVAEDAAPSGERLVGYAHLTTGTTPAAIGGPAPLELKRLYVARAWHGHGVAQALMQAALDAARQRHARTLWLGVWEKNARALAFYGKHGFSRVGEHTFMLGSDAQTDWLLERPVEPGGR